MVQPVGLRPDDGQNARFSAVPSASESSYFMNLNNDKGFSSSVLKYSEWFEIRPLALTLHCARV